MTESALAHVPSRGRTWLTLAADDRTTLAPSREAVLAAAGEGRREHDGS